MSLVNVFLSPHRALIGVDTQAYDYTTGKFINLSKLVHFPHANTIMASRGTNIFTNFLYGALSQAAARKGGDGFESLAEAMPEAFEETYHCINAAPTAGIERSGQQTVLVGWSHHQNRMRAVFFEKTSSSAGVNVTQIQDPGYMMPWDTSTWGEAPDGDDSRTMIQLPLSQARRTKQESPGTAMGGRLMLAELTRDRMAFSTHALESEVISFSVEELNGKADSADLADRLQRACALTDGTVRH
jgi:hypothetical protein